MKTLLSIFILTLLFFSCSENPKDTEVNDNINIDSITQSIEIIRHEQLINAIVENVGDGLNDKTGHIDELSSKPYDKIAYKDTAISIESYFEVAGCTGYEGNIDVKNDSITLKLESNTNISCTELIYYKVTYNIANPKKKKYKIRKQ